jgi:hypothetical protein
MHIKHKIAEETYDACELGTDDLVDKDDILEALEKAFMRGVFEGSANSDLVDEAVVLFGPNDE